MLWKKVFIKIEECLPLYYIHFLKENTTWNESCEINKRKKKNRKSGKGGYIHVCLDMDTMNNKKNYNTYK